MYKSIDSNVYEKAGDYNLSDIVMVSYTGKEVDITSFVAVNPGACVIVDLGIRSHEQVLEIEIEVAEKIEGHSLGYKFSARACKLRDYP